MPPRLVPAIACLWMLAPGLAAQSWVTVRNGPATNDGGSAADAIIRSEIIDIEDSPATFNGGNVTFVHPSGFDETRDGTIVIGFNGGASEGEGNQAYVMRKPVGGDWSVPQILEDDQQIDFGVIYQPRNVIDAPVLAYYWFGAAPSEGPPGAVRVSHDDGRTWSARNLLPQSSHFDHGSGDRVNVGMNHPIEWPDGTLWFACNEEADGGLNHSPALIAKVPPDNYANDGGTPWEVVNIQGGSNDANVMGSWLILSPDMQDLAYVSRSGSANINRSTDGGQTWGTWKGLPASPTPAAGISSVSLDWDDPTSPLNGWHAAAGARDANKRRYLTVHISQDPMNSWSEVLKLNNYESRDGNQSAGAIPPELGDDGENADPTFFQARDGSIHLLFTGRGGHVLKYYVIDPWKLTGETPSSGSGNADPVARASATPTSGDAPLAVGFDASASSDPDGDPLSFSWDFGDGASGSGAAPSHTYQGAGTYTATVTVVDGNGGTDGASVTISVSAGATDQDPAVQFTAPADGDTLAGSVAINAAAWDPDAGTADGDGIAQVVFELLDGTGTVAASRTESVVTYDWPLDTTTVADGTYTLRATATSTAAAGGSSAGASIAVTIANGGGGGTTTRSIATQVLHSGAPLPVAVTLDPGAVQVTPGANEVHIFDGLDAAATHALTYAGASVAAAGTPRGALSMLRVQGPAIHR